MQESVRPRIVPISPKQARLLVPREQLDALVKSAKNHELTHPLGRSGVRLCVTRQRAKLRHEIVGAPAPVNELVAALEEKARVDALLKKWMN